MHVYRVMLHLNGLDPDIDFFATQAEMHQGAKKHHKDNWPKVQMDLLDIATDKEAIVALLNHQEPKDTKVLRSWDLSQRGGLEEVPVEV